MVSKLILQPIHVFSLVILFPWLITASSLPGQELTAEPEKNIVRDNRPGAGGGKSLAILIGVQDYDSVDDLKYCRNDVRLLEKTLREVCNFDQVVAMTDDAAEPQLRPTLGNISKQLRLWLKVANNGEYDRVLLYFSGHGFRDAKDRLYFAPPDCDRQNLELTGLPQSYVRQLLDGCTRVPVKLLILDCCHSGTNKGSGVGTSPSEQAAVFAKAKGLLTLASCLDSEVSLEWDAKQQGLFTYWLCEGLKGGAKAEADRDRDSVIDSDELHRYVFNRVQETAATMAREQTVALRPSDDWQGVAVLSRMERRPVEMKDGLDVTATFTVREVDAKGPLVPDAAVELWYRLTPTAQPTVLGRGTTDSRGRARVAAKLSLVQQMKGEFAVMALARDEAKSWRLPDFLVTRNYSLYLPRPPKPLAKKAIENSIGMKLALIPAGEFLMGSPASEEDRGHYEHQHRVRITQPFYLGVYEVTQEEYERVMGTNPSGFTRGGSREDDVAGMDTSRFPVENVCWDDAVEFCRKLSSLPAEKSSGRVYRLPTEAEWEYACRSGTTTPFHFGTTLNGDEANCDGNYPYGTETKGTDLQRPTTVGSYAPNGFGLYDMHGNVHEWCNCWHEAGYYWGSPVDDPQGPTTASRRVLRGGCWDYDAGLCRSADRDGISPSGRGRNLGFRVALVPPGK